MATAWPTTSFSARTKPAATAEVGRVTRAALAKTSLATKPAELDELRRPGIATTATVASLVDGVAATSVAPTSSVASVASVASVTPTSTVASVAPTMLKRAREEVEVMVSKGGRRPRVVRVVGDLRELDAEGLPPLRKTAGNPGFGRREVAVVWREVRVMLTNCLEGDKKHITESDGSNKTPP